MYRHDSTCLNGPITRSREWWFVPEEETTAEGRLAVLPAEQSTGGVRHELVARVRRQIAEGTYDTPQRWEAALDRLLDRLCDD